MTLVELPAEECQVTSDTPMSVVRSQLESRLELPGIIVCDQDRFLGMVSRPRMMERLSQPFALEIYLRRPVRMMLDDIEIHALVLPGDLGIHEAARQALDRPSESVFEPVVVSDPARPGQWRLLDIHTLLHAQTALLQMANETIEQQKAAAEAANDAKSLFLANMSHEIRTPLTAILGFAENLLDTELPEAERRNAAKTIVRNGEHLVLIINDILDLSKIEAGRVDAERLRFSPAQLISDVVSVMRVRANARQLALQLSWETPLPESIESDPTRLRQILINLVGNAIKFTHQGSVEIRVAMQAERPTPSLVCSIVDTGIGMTPLQVSQLFQPFSQADQSTTRRFGGTGLGLSISRRLARILGGDISVRSEPGRGSTFEVHVVTGSLAGVRWLTDPSEGIEASDAREHVASVELKGHVLLAEDSPDNQLLISAFLRKAGVEVTLAENGQIASDLALAALQAGTPFDVVLMDMQMPTLDGYEATQRLRQAGYPYPIIALTANAMQSDRQRCFDSGCNDYATKPINRQQLIQQIAAQLGPSSQLAPPVERTPICQEVSSRATSPVFDREVALSRTGGDTDLYELILQVLVDNEESWWSQLDGALERGDLPTVHRLAHTLKGAADNIGAQPTYEAATHLELLAQSERGGELAPARQRLAEEWTRLSRAVRECLPGSQKSDEICDRAVTRNPSACSSSTALARR